MGELSRAREKLLAWKADPVKLVREEFQAEPDLWQAEALRAAGDPAVLRIALKACKGPGKTAVLAWIILWFLATRTYPKVLCTSITEANIKANLWPELSKWLMRSEFFRETFVWTATRVSYRALPDNWFAEARSWPKQANAEQQADALAGHHADHVMAVCDESGGVPQAVMVALEAIFANCVEGKLIQSGNPTHTTGPLYRACTIDRALWTVITITGDPERADRSPRISIEWARQQIASYGRENPWVMVNVLGEFPPSSINALLGVEEVEAAMRRHYAPDVYETQQKRLGVDVARFGDDRTVIFPRQGLACFKPIIMRQAKTTLIAARVAMAIQRWGAELTLVDDTGHWGHGVIDQLGDAGYAVIPINYADPAINPRYRNRRAENWLTMADAIKAGAALPYMPEMIPELTEPTYTFVGGRFVLEEKDQIKLRLGASPDLADGLSNTYALPEMPSDMLSKLRGSGAVRHDVDPYRLEDAIAQSSGVAHDFDPLDFDRDGRR